MSGPEDKTLNTIKVLSDKNASCDQGSITTNGGIYAKKNVMCEETVATNCLVVSDMAKIAGDLVIGGRLCCQGIYDIDDHTVSYKRSLNPARTIKNLTLGAPNCPWKEIYSECLRSDHVESSSLSAGTNTNGISTLLVQNGHAYINGNFAFVNPETNNIMLKDNNGTIETYTPIYQQWSSFQPLELCYQPNTTLHITSSVIMMNIGENQQLELCYDANLVPINTKVKVYFVHQKQSAWAKYCLVLFKNNKKFLFTSDHPSKKISLFFLEKNIYLIN